MRRRARSLRAATHQGTWASASPPRSWPNAMHAAVRLALTSACAWRAAIPTAASWRRSSGVAREISRRSAGHAGGARPRIDRAASIPVSVNGQTSLFGRRRVIERCRRRRTTSRVRDVSGPYALRPTSAQLGAEFLGMYLSAKPLAQDCGSWQQRVDTTSTSSRASRRAHRPGGRAIPDMRTFVPRGADDRAAGMAALQIEDLTQRRGRGVCPRVRECVSALRPDAVIVVRRQVEAANDRRWHVHSRGGGGRARRPRTASILAEAVYAYDDPVWPTWRKDSTVHISVNASQIGILGHSGMRSRAPGRLLGDPHVDSGRASTRSPSPSTSRSSRVLRWSEQWSSWWETTHIASRCAGFVPRNASAPAGGAEPGAGRT